MGRFLQTSLLVAAVAPAVIAAGVKCGPGSACPEDTPCCSQYGECGTGAYCLGGCDPINSYSLNACMPAPVCESKTYDFNNLDGMVENTKYLGDASKADWVYSGEPVEYQNSVLLTMAQGTVGTLLATNHYIWYGKVSGRFKTSAGNGVVTAFILLSDVKDEIDFEFVGNDLTTAQTNFYSLGVTNYNNGGRSKVSSDTMQNFHDYEIDWQPDKLTWSIDGNVVRTLKKADTWNETANRFTYPQTPSRLQLSLWPAGLPTNPEGTVEWGGGEISWNSKYMTNGYYYAQFDQISVDCYDPPSGANVQGSVSYTFTDKAATNNTVKEGNDGTVLKSFLATGLDKNVEDPSTASASGAAVTTRNTVPGLSGAGPGNDGNRGSESSSAGTSATSSGGSAATGFSQGGSNAASTNMQPESVLSGSIFAVVIAIVGLCVL